MKIIPKTQKDFEWVNWTPKQIKENLDLVLDKTKEDLNKIKLIPEKERSFLNTIFAYENAGNVEGVRSHFADVLFYISPKKSQRQAGQKYSTEFSQKMTDLIYDNDLYKAFNEYNPRKEKLNESEKKLYKTQKDFYEKAGFHLSEKDQKELKNIIKEITKLNNKFSSNINNFSKNILCTKDELDGMSSNFISSLKKDKKTGKYIVDTSYPLHAPFMEFAKSDKKRKELADLNSQKGGKNNLKILSRLLELRHKKAKMLGFKNYNELILSDRMSKTPEKVKNILSETLLKVKPELLRRKRFFDYFKAKKTGKRGDVLRYYDSSYYGSIYMKEEYNIDNQEIKEYFELNHVLQEIFNLFGGLFGVSFMRNKEIKLWHKDVIVFDVTEKGKKISMLILDLFPREGKYSHMAHWGFMEGNLLEYPSSKNYEMPVSMIIGNFPKESKGKPSLLSPYELRVLFHEFGHSCHSMLTRAPFKSQAGSDVDPDFSETPSQLFENWIGDINIFESFSKHHKTGKKIPKEILRSMEKKKKDFPNLNYNTMAFGLLDFELHSGKKIKDLNKFSNNFLKNLENRDDTSPKSLFPAGWGHMTDYASSYYTYSISLIYSYDVFSMFKERGLLNKKTGKDLRDKILARGGSGDEMQYMKDFLGRKPNNKAFLEALGLKIKK